MTAAKGSEEIAKKIVTDYFCFHVPDLMRNGKSQDYWIEKQTQAIAEALNEAAKGKEEEIEVWKNSAQGWKQHYTELWESEPRPAGSYALPMAHWQPLPSAALKSSRAQAERVVDAIRKYLEAPSLYDASDLRDALKAHDAALKAEEKS